ncbi:glycosyltransferase family 4 protein [Polynucleobacter sp. MWH-UH2A]|uniref:glycosyltransferase family 4 protein n=1 Tax=Polynucleobacter sp. MWH-UH2A TaxID=1855617 RepID=UPI001BFD2E91|nr:glycosyltransferase [Polynucleobacter sp. MWH-UH2A]QWD64390.1 glycosyltransferase family 4 protein [Polynucleobacter sp. MWH-UH2A]
MSSLILAFFTSFIVTVLIIRTQKLHESLSGDLDLSGPQKFHSQIVPRVGGIGIALALTVGILFHASDTFASNQEWLLLVSAIPVFFVGITEDISKKVSVRMRLAFTAIGALILILLLDANINRLDVMGIDHLIAMPVISILFTVFAITGLANAYNIIDGFNGLSSMVGMITLVGLGYMGIQMNDSLITFLSFTMISAILGFFIWNYPRGLIFLGDGGAYLIGFWVAAITVLIVSRHPEISPWFAVMINAYPILETLFTIYRRKFHQGKSPGHPDGIHFHSLIFRRVLNPTQINNEMEWFNANAKTSPYLWVLSTLAVIPAILFWRSTAILLGFLVIFTVSYIWLYKSIVNFKTPKWLNL